MAETVLQKTCASSPDVALMTQAVERSAAAVDHVIALSQMHLTVVSICLAIFAIGGGLFLKWIVTRTADERAQRIASSRIEVLFAQYIDKGIVDGVIYQALEEISLRHGTRYPEVHPYESKSDPGGGFPPNPRPRLRRPR